MNTDGSFTWPPPMWDADTVIEFFGNIAVHEHDRYERYMNTSDKKYLDPNYRYELQQYPGAASR